MSKKGNPKFNGKKQIDPEKNQDEPEINEENKLAKTENKLDKPFNQNDDEFKGKVKKGENNSGYKKKKLGNVKEQNALKDTNDDQYNTTVPTNEINTSQPKDQSIANDNVKPASIKKKKIVTKEKLQLKIYNPEIESYIEQHEEQQIFVPEQPQVIKETKEEKPRKEPTPCKLTGDLSKLNIRVGKITKVLPHPIIDKYYVNQVLMGRTYEKPSITKLRPHYTRKELKNKMVVVVRNVRNKRHFLHSLCYILFAKSGNKLELLEPPPESVIGENVQAEGYFFQPTQDKFIKPRKEGDKLLQAILTEFKVNSEGKVEYRGIPLLTASGGFITAPSLRDCVVSK